MDTLDRYLIKQYLIYFFLLWFSLTAIYLGIDFFSKFWNIQLESSKVIQLYGYKIPQALQLFVPVACFMAALLLLTSLSQQNEILALYSGGVGILRILSALLLVVGAICVITFLFFDNLVPLYAKKQYLLSIGKDPNSDIEVSTGRSRLWFRSGNIVFNIGRLQPSEKLLEDIDLYLLDSSFQIYERIRANKAIYEMGDWTLQEGFRLLYPLEASRYPKSETFQTLRGIIPSPPEDFKVIELKEDTMKLKDLRRTISRNKSYGLDTDSQQVSYHERIALVFTPLIFILIAIPYATHPLKTHSIAKSVGYCFLMVFLYLVIFRFGVSLGKGGKLTPWVGAWITNGLFLIYSFFLLKRYKV